MTTQVRVVRTVEWRRARDLRLRALADAPDAFGSTLERERAFGESEWLEWITGWEGVENTHLVAIVDGIWVGMAVGSQADGDPVAHLYGMWVEPAVRGRGVGGRLVDGVIAWATSRGAAVLELGVAEGNDVARSLYEGRGFTDTGRRDPLREGSRRSLLVLRRPLAAR